VPDSYRTEVHTGTSMANLVLQRGVRCRGRRRDV